MIVLKVNELNNPIKRQRLTGFYRKKKTVKHYTIMFAYKRPNLGQRIHIDRYQGDEKGYFMETNRNEKKEEVAIVISDKIDFKLKAL